MENNEQFAMQKITNNIFSADNNLECFILSNMFDSFTEHWDIVYFNCLNECKIVYSIFEDLENEEKYAVVKQQLYNTSMRELVYGIDFEEIINKSIELIKEIRKHEGK